MIVQPLADDWQFRQVGSNDWFPAVVPGDVHIDLMAIGKIPDPFVAFTGETVDYWIRVINVTECPASAQWLAMRAAVHSAPPPSSEWITMATRRCIAHLQGKRGQVQFIVRQAKLGKSGGVYDIAEL